MYGPRRFVASSGGTVDWIQDRWSDLTNIGSATWLAIAAWAAVVVALAALIYAHQQIRRNRQLNAEQIRPHVVMFMEPDAADWHLIELVVRNFGQTAAYDIQFAFSNPPTIARYEDGYQDGMVDVVELSLPDELPVLAPGQEWRTMWDSAMDRNQIGNDIESRFVGAVSYYDRPATDGRRFGRKRLAFRTKIDLDWNTLPPVPRLELMTAHDLAQQERRKLELLRSVLTYFQYAAQETRPDVLQAEIERINQAREQTQDRLRNRELDATTKLRLPWVDNSASGRHHRNSN
jgi:hypothetical protein